MPTSTDRDTWAIYQAAWEDISASERRELLGRSVTEDCVYTDPVGDARGHDALVGYIEAFREATPDGTFRNHTFLSHHGQMIATWTLHAGGAAQPGGSCARFADDGRLSVVTGFFEVPAQADGAS